MRLLLSIGFVNTLCSTCGHDTREDFWAWMAGAAGAWTAAGAATCGFLDLSTRAGGAGLASAALDALADTDTWLTQASTSMSSVDALVSLALGEPAGAGAGAGAVECRSRLAAAAYMALLHASDAVLSRLSVPVSQDGDNKDELPEYVQVRSVQSTGLSHELSLPTCSFTHELPELKPMRVRHLIHKCIGVGVVCGAHGSS